MEPPYLGSFVCDICMQRESNGEVYRCEICQFDVHPECAEMKDKVDVIFHDHSLHLLQDPYNNPNVICYFCQESLQESKWVYTCEECNFDVHALCTKYVKEWMWYDYHPHPLTLVHCQSSNRLFCICCNGEVRGKTWYYTCSQKLCAFELHPSCSMRSWNPLCIFDNSHRLDLIATQKHFYCGRCDEQGFSWLCHCDHCDVDIHIDCIDDMEEEVDWNVAYEKFMLEQETIGNPAKMDMIIQLLDKLMASDALEASSSSTSRPPSGVIDNS
jgi:hypothetical protein